MREKTEVLDSSVK